MEKWKKYPWQCQLRQEKVGSKAKTCVSPGFEPATYRPWREEKIREVLCDTWPCCPAPLPASMRENGRARQSSVLYTWRHSPVLSRSLFVTREHARACLARAWGSHFFLLCGALWFCVYTCSSDVAFICLWNGSSELNYRRVSLQRPGFNAPKGQI